MLALSRADSGDSSHLLVGGIRNPGCGGPNWRAGRIPDEEKLLLLLINPARPGMMMDGRRYVDSSSVWIADDDEVVGRAMTMMIEVAVEDVNNEGER